MASTSASPSPPRASTSTGRSAEETLAGADASKEIDRQRAREGGRQKRERGKIQGGGRREEQEPETGVERCVLL